MALGKFPPLADVPGLKGIRESLPRQGQLPSLRRDVPLLNGVQFAIRTHAEGGASFNTHSNRFLNAGVDKAYVVGGEPDTKGERIPTKQVPHVDTPTAMEHIENIRSTTGNRRGAIAGSWVAPGRVDLDASSAFTTHQQAMSVATKRNEEAYWDNEAGEEVLTKHGKKARGIK
jgi:hypothetical protein